MPYFSVIVPVYNKQRFVQRTIGSILSQTFTDFELIIIDDGSTDKSEKKILEFSDLRITYYKTDNRGVSSARNFGIEKAKSEFISFLDADDYWYPDFLSEMKSMTEDHPQHKIFASAIEIEKNSKIKPAEYSMLRHANVMPVNYFSGSMKESVITTQASVFHRSVFEEVGKFDETLYSGEDTDLWIRIGIKYPILFNWKVLARYIRTARSLSSQISNIDLKKYESAAVDDPRIRKFLDLNRYSLAIQSKMTGNQSKYEILVKDIDPKSIGIKAKLLLKLPGFVLKILKMLSGS